MRTAPFARYHSLDPSSLSAAVRVVIAMRKFSRAVMAASTSHLLDEEQVEEPPRENAACGLASKHCLSCESGVPALPRQDVEAALATDELGGWELVEPAGPQESLRIARAWRLGNFKSALKFVNDIGELAEMENHHPDLHLTSYRHVRAELYTHSINGLSGSDLVLAARINQIPVKATNPKKNAVQAKDGAQNTVTDLTPAAVAPAQDVILLSALYGNWSSPALQAALGPLLQEQEGSNPGPVAALRATMELLVTLYSYNASPAWNALKERVHVSFVKSTARTNTSVGKALRALPLFYSPPTQ